jgi:putative protein-disulfide isomerase|tara:strand:+ start:542 stop:1147 length:606 start_codon:yes stop_codon:yes gene_type:complete
MCGWCWGFRPTWQQLETQVKTTLDIVYVVGGLAADSDQPMPMAMQQTLAATWQRIQQHIPGTDFNHAFWNATSDTQPRRSTYPACRAVLAAKIQDPSSEKAMILGIQQAYYLNAQNTSNIDVLASVAGNIGLNTQQFTRDMASQTLELELQQQIKLARQLSNQGFPSLVLSKGGRRYAIPLDYNNSHSMQQAIMKITSPVV